MIRLSSFKHGSTFSYIGTVKDSGDNPVIGIANYITSDIRTSNNELISSVVVTEIGQGQYSFVVSDTTKWPINCTLYTDIRYEKDGVVSYSDTMSIEVVKEVTKYE